MSFIGVVETAHVDQGTVTNRHSKQVVKRPNGLLEGHRVDFDITKKSKMMTELRLWPKALK
jgi:hypothetical protein